MKLINYNYGYNNTFNTCIHGKIVVSKQLWVRMLKYLFNPAVEIIDWDIDKRILKEDIKRLIITKAGTLVNIRVNATQKLVHKFKIKKYRLGNYMFLIKN